MVFSVGIISLISLEKFVIITYWQIFSNINHTSKICLTICSNLLQIAVHLWATGDESLSSHSFLIIRDITSVFSSNYFDYCFVKAYKTYSSHSQSVEPRLLKHIQFLRNSFVELCSLDVQKSSDKAMICMQHVAKILQRACQTKRKVSLQSVPLYCLLLFNFVFKFFFLTVRHQN